VHSRAAGFGVGASADLKRETGHLAAGAVSPLSRLDLAPRNGGEEGAAGGGDGGRVRRLRGVLWPGSAVARGGSTLSQAKHAVARVALARLSIRE